MRTACGLPRPWRLGSTMRAPLACSQLQPALACGGLGGALASSAKPRRAHTFLRGPAGASGAATRVLWHASAPQTAVRRVSQLQWVPPPRQCWRAAALLSGMTGTLCARAGCLLRCVRWRRLPHADVLRPQAPQRRLCQASAPRSSPKTLTTLPRRSGCTNGAHARVTSSYASPELHVLPWPAPDEPPHVRETGGRRRAISSRAATASRSSLPCRRPT